MPEKTPIIEKEHLTVDDCLKLYEEEGILGLVDKVKAITLKVGIEKGRQQVIEWGNEICPHSKALSEHLLPVNKPKRECGICWAELEKEDPAITAWWCRQEKGKACTG